MGFVIYHLSANANLDGQGCFVTNQCVSQAVFMVIATHRENVYVILGGLELIVVNAYHSPGAIGKTDIAKNQWNANVTTGTMETFANMRIVNQDVTNNMATVYIPILAGVIQVGPVNIVLNACDTLDVKMVDVVCHGNVHVTRDGMERSVIRKEMGQQLHHMSSHGIPQAMDYMGRLQISTIRARSV